MVFISSAIPPFTRFGTNTAQCSHTSHAACASAHATPTHTPIALTPHCKHRTSLLARTALVPAHNIHHKKKKVKRLAQLSPHFPFFHTALLYYAQSSGFQPTSTTSLPLYIIPRPLSSISAICAALA